jgi:Membrane bound FAD containing D-sorbitol dehydrogenase
MSGVARRGLLGGLLTASTLALIPWAAAQPAPNGERGAFVALSAILVGRQALDHAQATRLFNALAADDAGFPAAARNLLNVINQHAIDPLRLQGLLDEQGSPLAALPRKIVTAWCLGVVGVGSSARCLAFETALNAVMVSDVLKPPTYAFGGYGSWTAPPPSAPAAPAVGAPPSSAVEITPHG